MGRKARRLIDQVYIERRFQKSVKLDFDINSEDSMDGFVPVKSSIDAFNTMARYVLEHRDSAFTFTGPYGSGKSTFALCLASLFSDNKLLKSRAIKYLCADNQSYIRRVFLQEDSPYRCITLVGGSSSLRECLYKALMQRYPDCKADGVIEFLGKISLANNILIIADELGKFIERAISDQDTYFMQELAEFVSRSSGKIVFIGILHQSFDAYIGGLNSSIRNEWAKIQGRYQNLPLAPSPLESLSLISRSIGKKGYNELSFDRLLKKFVKEYSLVNSSFKESLHDILLKCLPLHPLTVMILCSISRKSYGQNERSIYSFLNSLEPFSFNSFINEATVHELYMPYHLYDYLKVNQDINLSLSRDGHKWAIANELIDRYENNADDETVNIIKTIALIDIFGGLFQVLPRASLLALALNIDTEAADARLRELIAAKAVIKREVDSSYRLFIGSDFNFEEELEAELARTEFSIEKFRECISENDRIVAKRHYIKTGALRWFGISYITASELDGFIKKLKLDNGHFGEIILVVNDLGEISGLNLSSIPHNFLLGFIGDSDDIVLLSRKLVAVSNIRNNPLLSGDEIAREEVDIRFEDICKQVGQMTEDKFSKAKWYYQGNEYKNLNSKNISSLSSFVSDIADRIYSECIPVNNELVNRNKVSPNVKGATRLLFEAMIDHSGEDNLGFVKFPAQYFLYASILKNSGIHYYDQKEKKYFINYKTNSCDKGYAYFFARTEEFLNKKGELNLSELYDFWGEKPFGIKSGVQPILAMTLVISNFDKIALYDEQGFITELSTQIIDPFMAFPRKFKIKWYGYSKENQDVLKAVYDTLKDYVPSIQNSSLLSVARALVRFAYALPNLTKETNKVSAAAKTFRAKALSASDPVDLVFKQLLSIFPDIRNDPKQFKLVLDELNGFMQSQMALVKEKLIEVLDLNNYEEMIGRSGFVQKTDADTRTKKFASIFTESPELNNALLKRLITFCSEKPFMEWTDNSIESTLRELPVLSLSFRQSECFSTVKNMKPNRRILCLTFPAAADKDLTIMAEVSVGREKEIRRQAELLYSKLNSADKNEAFAVLAELGSLLKDKYINGN